jgi:hypothetical protein
MNKLNVIGVDKEAPLKTVEQQGLQAIQRSRELLVRKRVAGPVSPDAAPVVWAIMRTA